MRRHAVISCNMPAGGLLAAGGPGKASQFCEPTSTPCISHNPFDHQTALLEQSKNSLDCK